MENYIVINGKKAELTEEQLKQLSLKVEEKRNNPFNSELEDGEEYFIIDSGGVKPFLHNYYDIDITDNQRLNNINSFNDKDFAYQVYLHELLNRKLLKYAWDNKAEDCDWTDAHNEHWYISRGCGQYTVYKTWSTGSKVFGVVYFSNKEVADKAIKDVIVPFMNEHPDFVW